MMHDPLSAMLSKINNAQKAGKTELKFKPASKLELNVLELLKKHGYIKDYQYADDKKGGIITIKLANRINAIGPIRPRFSVQLAEYEKFEQRYLPAKDFGLLIVSTSKGLLSHIEAKKKKIGGVLLGYVY